VIVAHALLRIRDGDEAAFEQAMRAALPLIAGAAGYRGFELRPAMEATGFYLVRVLWDDIASHRDGFRRSPRYAEVMALIGPFIEQPPEVSYFGASVIDSQLRA